MSRPKGFKHTEETIEKMKINHKGFLGHKHTPEEKNKIGQKAKGRKPMLGKKCSEETKLKMSEAHRGEMNSNWKNGITETIRGIRRSPKYYQWRKTVLARDGYTCQKCGNQKKLHAHHIKPLLDFPELIFEVGNGIIYCEDCHNNMRRGE